MSIASMWNEKLLRLSRGGVLQTESTGFLHVRHEDLRALVDDALEYERVVQAWLHRPNESGPTIVAQLQAVTDERDRLLSRVDELDIRCQKLLEKLGETALAQFERTRERCAMAADAGHRDECSPRFIAERIRALEFE